ncbi:MAG: hypothetical protein WCN27_00170 [Alphaproteobacteria bacterium]
MIVLESQKLDKQKEITMNDLDKHHAQTKTQAFTDSSPLFKAQDKSSNQEVYFSSPQEAYEWMIAHQSWVLKKREIINWSFPLEQVVTEECWVKIE